MVQWSPFVMSFKKKYPWIQLAGHAGSTVLPDFLSGTDIWLSGGSPSTRGRGGQALDAPGDDCGGAVSSLCELALAAAAVLARGGLNAALKARRRLSSPESVPPRPQTRTPCLGLGLCLSRSLALSPSLTQ